MQCCKKLSQHNIIMHSSWKINHGCPSLCHTSL
uniref:Uncharacterized protein n=1 Tax=Arundo donax TaxID=35708 RepID=A0A0A9B774_ARUDO